jgi:hypothetical protein
MYNPPSNQNNVLAEPQLALPGASTSLLPDPTQATIPVIPAQVNTSTTVRPHDVATAASSDGPGDHVLPLAVLPNQATTGTPARQDVGEIVQSCQTEDQGRTERTGTDVAAVSSVVAIVQSIPEATGESSSMFWDSALKDLELTDAKAYKSLIERRGKNTDPTGKVITILKRHFETYVSYHKPSTRGESRDFVATEKLVISFTALEPTKAATFVLRAFYYGLQVRQSLL